MISPTFLLASLVTLVLDKPAAHTFQLHESVEGPPSGFSLAGSADPDRMLSMRVALVRSNVDELERRLYDVSTPSSANYGKHLSKSEV